MRGLCDPELQKDERYPVDMHCIFAGARGLFLDRLIRDTSAEVQVPEPGRLRLLGQAESVVMAQSRVQQFVALFQVDFFFFSRCYISNKLMMNLMMKSIYVWSRRSEVYPVTRSLQ